MAKKYWADVRIGGGTGAIDKIPGTNLKDKDGLVLLEPTDTARFWWLDDDASGAEGEAIVNPDVAAGTKSWLLLGITVPNAGLHVLDTDASHDLIIKPGSDLSADRTLTLTTGDADRTLSIEANSIINQDLSSDAGVSFAGVTLPNAGWIGIGAALERLEFHTAGYATFMGCNLGIQTTDMEAWHSTYRGIEFYETSIMGNTGATDIYIISNAYFDGSWKHKSTDEAIYLRLYDGTFALRATASGTEDDPISWTTLLGVDNSGNVDISLHNAATVGLKLGGTLVTSSAAELNLLDGVTATTAEINQLDGNAFTVVASIKDAMHATYPNLVGIADISSTDAQAEGKGGVLAFGGKYTDAGAYAQFATIRGVKANSTTSNYEGKLYLGVRTGTAANLAEVSLDKVGNFDIIEHDAATIGLKLGGTLVTTSAGELNLNDGSVAGTIVNSKSVIYGASGEVNATTLEIAGNLLNVSTNGTDTTVVGALNVTALAGADPATHKAVYYNTTTKSLFYDNT
ncbi:MAG: hypothetical protein E3J56_11055 [Candidatus Aminicenantes bacterium]|nr:MAG: hypothetical protein E3J56_11055 [Candidatus Aminicenantes bacterium]